PLLFVLAVGLTSVAATTVANHSPEAPTRLTVDGRADPLAIDGVPHFSWLPRDRDDNEVQSAYQVVVRRGDHTVWASGPVTSSRQSGVPGPPPTPGPPSRWTGRTWDRRDAVSQYAQPTTFDTGLTDADWDNAAWIRRPATGNDATNDWTLARKVIPVSKSRVTR